MKVELTDSNKKVVIIGAGVAGLSAAKECLAQGLEPVVLEKSNRIGGLWNNDEDGHVWEGMRTNLSHHSCAFPDFKWKKNTSLFPNQNDVLRYFNEFSNHFNLMTRADFRFNSRVESISQDETGAYNIKTNGTVEKFGKVIVASGFFSEPYIPDFLQRLSNVTHSSNINTFKEYEGQNVTVVGNGFSGCDIAVGLAKYANQVHHVFARPYYMIPRTAKDNKPIDSVFYTYPDKKDEPKLSALKRYAKVHSDFSHYNEAQSEASSNLTVKDINQPPYVSITDGYLEAVKAKKIKTNNKLDSLNVADTVIAATGFKTNLEFLSSDILKRISYDPEDRFMPVLLDDGVWSPDLPNMAFTGMYRGPFFLTIALQTKWIAKAFAAPHSFYPSKKDMEQGVLKALDIKKEVPRPQFPYGDYVDYSLRLSKAAGIDVKPTTRAGQMVSPYHFREGPAI